MRRLAFVLITFLGSSALAADGAATDEPALFMDGTEVALSDFEWLKRPLVVFADSPNDPRFRQQIDLLQDSPDLLETRDVVVLTDTDPAAQSALRTELRPRGFMLVVMGKDGKIYLRKPSPRNLREITRSIDGMPLRQQEIRDRRADPIR